MCHLCIFFFFFSVLFVPIKKENKILEFHFLFFILTKKKTTDKMKIRIQCRKKEQVKLANISNRNSSSGCSGTRTTDLIFIKQSNRKGCEFFFHLILIFKEKKYKYKI